MLALYPEIKPYAEHRLAVGNPHELYIEECGSPEGIPVLFVHGGPGAGSSSQGRRYFDPGKYRIILYDQRGAGRSTPHACLESNTTQNLIEDIEAIRTFLSIEKWMLFGGSWGSTLSLVYAQAHPEQVLGLILRGVFLFRQKDIDWFYQDGASRVFPDYWEDYCSPIPEDERHNFVEAYFKLLNGGNELARMGAAKAWALWEAHCATMRPNHALIEAFADPHLATALACIEAHYCMHKGFLEENQILNNVDKLKGIPGMIVHGRYDMICPLENAVSLRRLWHDSELHIIRDAGHSASEPGIVDGLIRATRDMARRFED